MTLRMLPRTKLLAAVAAALLAGAATVVVLAGPATASQWHSYKGDVFAGHAYGLHVPAKAESFEVSWSGPEGGSASLALFDPAGAKVGHYALSPALDAALVAAPQEGRYVLYVYELSGGALNVRVNAPAAPLLDVEKLKLVREDVPVATVESPGPLDKGLTATLRRAPVFLTLLYEGSAEDLDATVTGPKGVVLTVTDETGTAFSPGVYSSLSGSRKLDAAALEGATYTVEARAASFQGALYLTTLSVDAAAPVEPAPPKPVPGGHVHPPHASHPAWTESPTFALGEGKAYAFEAKAGDLHLADPSAAESAEEGYARIHGAVSVYAPDDTLVAHVVLDDEKADATVALPVDGEYVAYVHSAGEGFVLARLAGAPEAPALRELALVEERFELETTSLPGKGEMALVLARSPVALRLEPLDRGAGAFSQAVLSNERGVVAEHGSLVDAPGVRVASWSTEYPENFAAGEHTLRLHGILGGSVVLTAVSYDRLGAVAPEAAAPDHAEEEEEHEEEEEGHDKPLPLPGLPSNPLAYGAGLLGLG